MHIYVSHPLLMPVHICVTGAVSHTFRQFCFTAARVVMAGDVEAKDLLVVEMVVGAAYRNTLLLPHSGLLKNKDAIEDTSYRGTSGASG